MTDKWGCPDWRDASAYPSSGDSLETWQWGWEFVRRNPKYRERYKVIVEKYDLSVKQIPPDMSPEADLIRREFQMNLLYLYSLDDLHDPRRGYQDFEDNPFFTTAGVFASVPSKSWLLKKWDEIEKEGNERLRSWFEWVLTYLQLDGLTAPLGDEKDDRPERLKSIVAFTFDLDRPLRPQLHAAEHFLKKEAEGRSKKFPRPKLHGKVRDLWPLYLRVLDAEDQGATDKEIYEQLLLESESDLDLYDQLAGTENPYTLVADWRKAARATCKKVSYLL